MEERREKRGKERFLKKGEKTRNDRKEKRKLSNTERILKIIIKKL